MATIGSLSTIAKTTLASTHYLLIAETAGVANYKLLGTDLFPILSTLGTSSEALFVSITNKNTLNFKGIRSLNSLLTVATASNNIVLTVNEALINLANCSNATSLFLSSVSLTTNVTGILPVANGGSGLATLTANSLYVGNGTSALVALGAATNGQIPIGRTGLSPILATLTAGTNITVTNGSGTISIAASLALLTANLDAGTFNIFRFSWLSGDGQNEGIALNAAGRVFVGSSTPTSFFTYDLNVNSGIALNGAVTQSIEMIPTATPGNLTLQAASASVANVAGGTLSIFGGIASGTGNAGAILVRAGNTGVGSGIGGSATFEAGGSFSGNGGTAYLTGGSSNSATGGAVSITPGASTTGTPGRLLINQLSGVTAMANFVGTSGAASANSLSSSVATASAKTGAIKVQINGVDAWIRVYATGE
jgi:hypothetical protein